MLLPSTIARLGMSAREVTQGYIETPPAMKIPFDDTFAQVKQIANQMHIDKLIHATPNEDDLFLQCRT